MLRHPRRAPLALAVSLTLGLATLAVPTMSATAAPSAATSAAPAAITNGSLSDDAAAQQRWLSVPNSRVVLNPYNFENSGSELSQNSGKNLPLSNGYYAHDKAIRTQNVLNTYVDAGTELPQTGYSTDFDTIDGWTANEVNPPVVSGGKVTISPTKTEVNNSWGSIYSPEITLDLATYSKVTVKVAGTSPAGVGLWALKVNMTNGGTDIEGGPRLMSDSSVAGEFTYDLAAFMASYGHTGVQTFRLRLWTSNWDTGVASVSSTYDSISVHKPAAGSFPDAGQLTSWATDFDNATGWTPSNGGIALTTTGSTGRVALSSGEWSSVKSPTFTADLSKTPIVSVKVNDSTGKWALKVNDGQSGDVNLQGDTDATGTFSYDLRSLTTWTGVKNFSIKLFQVGSGTATTYDRLSVHSGGTSVRTTANAVSYTWTPAALKAAATYDNGTINTEEFFAASDPNAFTRVIKSNVSANIIVAGETDGRAPTYDAATSTITTAGEWATRSTTIPSSATVKFYTSRSAFLSNVGGTPLPTSASRFWSATLPGVGVYSIGVGWAPNAARNDSSTAVESSKSSAQSAALPSAAAQNAQHWVDFWDAYLVKVPVVQDFSIQRVASGGVTADQMKHAYYQAWVGLEMNVLPATPETGNLHPQLGTGKPSMWMNGTPGTKNVASWDSLLGMQQLVFTDPENAWASFEGMMALVNDSPTATEPTDTTYGTRGELGGESLPSRKAQTAWILYQATGDQQRLAAIYDKLKLHLNWEKFNMRWVLDFHNYFDERDSEFVASLIYDLKFAIEIAEKLGHQADADAWRALIPELTEKYQEWFFPTTPDRDGKVWPTVQKVYLNTTGAPGSIEATEGSWYLNENGRTVQPGFSFYTSTAFVMDQLEPGYMAKVMARFLADYDENKQLAGLGKFAVKAPDIQLIAYGLLQMGEVDKATVLINSITRDTVISGWFAEVYQQTGDGTIGGPITSRGVRPSLFGISNYIDFVLMANGVRTDEGVPTFVRLPGATGGVSGLTYMGENLDVDIDGEIIKLSGSAVDQGVLPSTVDASVLGKSTQPAVPIADDARLATLTINGQSVGGFDANKTAYAVTLPAGTTTVPTVAATTSRSGAQVVVTPAASLPGTTTITVTSASGKSVKTYTIAFSAKTVIPPTPVPVTFTSVTTKSASFGKASSVTVKTAAAGRVPTGVVQVHEGSKLLAQKALTAGNAVISLPKNLKVGKHTLKVTFTPASGTNLKAPVAKGTFVNVSKATAKVTKTKVTKGKIKKGQRVTIRVTLKGVTGAAPTGKVSVLLGKKKVGDAKVKKTKAGYTATIKTKKLSKKGKIAVTYSGNKSLVKKNYTTKLQVK